MAEIQGNVPGQADVALLKRNKNVGGEWNTDEGTITVWYVVITYYMEGGSEVIINTSDPKSYPADWATWEPTIKPAVELELVKEVPGTPAE